MKICRTDLRAENVLVAKLSGAVRAEVATVRKGQKYFFVAPERLGGTREVPADSLTDCMNFSVWRLGQEIRRDRPGRG